MSRFFSANLSNLDERNAFFLSLEVIWAAVLIAAQSFVVPYAVRLGATSAEIGLLNSIPALLTIILSLPIGQLLNTRRNAFRWVMGGMTASRLGLLLLALVPFISLDGLPKGTMVVIILIALNVPDLFYKIGQWPFIMRIIAEDRRIVVFTNRSLITLAVTGISVFLFGQWLDKASYPNNYQVMILISVALSQLSLVFWLKVKMPPEMASTNEAVIITADQKKSRWDIFRSLNFKTNFGRVVLNQTLAYLGIWTATPLYVLYTVRSLGASDAWIGLQVTLNSFASIFGWFIARKLTTHWGEPLALKRCSQLVTLYPILTGLSPTLGFVLFASVLNSIVSPIFSLSHNNNLLRSIPSGYATDGIAAYNTLISIAGFICPIIGVAIADYYGLRPTLIACGIISLIGSLSFHFWPVYPQQQKTTN